MPGKNCNGVATDTPFDRQSIAYCEGRQLATDGGSITNATATTGVEVSNNGITWTSKTPGDGKRVTLLDPGVNNAALQINVFLSEIVVSLATDGAGAISSTAADVIAAITGDPTAFVTAANTGASTGAALVVAESVVLSGSNYPAMDAKSAEDFQRGFDSFNGGIGTQLPLDCCAVPAFDGVP